MTPKKVFYGMVGLLVLIVLAGGGIFYFVDSQLATKTTEVNKLKAELDVLAIKINNSRQSADELEKYQDVQAILDSVLPPEKIQNELIAEILDIATRNATDLGSITFPSSGEFTDFTKSQTSIVEGVAGVLAVEINITATANFTNMLSLLEDFESNQRKLQVVSVNVQPEFNDDQVPTGNFKITMRINAYQRS